MTLRGPRPAAERGRVIPLLAEVFREHGYEGASLALIGRATGLGKGSLYHLFPNGKEQMAAEVLAEIDAWFEQNVFSPLRDEPDPRRAIRLTLARMDAYFQSGRRLCLVGSFALSDTRDQFAERVRGYFAGWVAAIVAESFVAGVGTAVVGGAGGRGLCPPGGRRAGA